MDYSLEPIYEWACNLLILEYRNSPKNRAFVRKLVDLIFANNILLKMRYGFDVETAIGAQLDIIGKWVGIDRYYDAIDLWEQNRFSTVNYSNILSGIYESWQGGFSDYSNFENHLISITLNETTFKNAVNHQEKIYVIKYTASGWQLDGKNITISDYGITYSLTNNIAINDTITINYFDDTITYKITSNKQGGFLMYLDWINTRTKVNQMGDAYFRSLIKLKIIKNNINHTMKNIDESIYQWSGGEVYTTWGTMEVTYHYPQELSNLFLLAAYKNVLIAPTGCEIKTEVIS